MTRVRCCAVLGVFALVAVGCSFPRPAKLVEDGAIAGGDAVSSPDSGSAARCGDSNLDSGEECDSGGVDSPGCDRDCTRPICGDGVLNLRAAEMCDDGNVADDGNGCDGQCRKNAICGDSRVQSLFEACDGGSGCSADCKTASSVLVPVSDRGGIDIRANGTWDGLDQEDSTGEAVTWLPQSSFGDAQERRIALEFDTGALHREYLVTDAHLAFFPSNISGGPRTLQLHGYAGNGAVEVQDMTADHLVTSFVAATTAPVSLDVKAFMQAAADQQYLFAGFLLRLELIKPADDLFNLGVSMSNNMDRNVVPRLSIVYCVDANHDLKCD